MKSIAIAAIVITICALSFLSCSKNKDGTSSAPTNCGNEAAVGNIVTGTKYYYAPQNCATGQFGAVDSFSISANQCLKIEIP